jgi:hypothetical protein
MRPVSWLEAVAYGIAVFVLVVGIGLVAGRPMTGWLVTAGALSVGTLLAGVLHVAARPEPEIAPTRDPHTDV